MNRTNLSTYDNSWYQPGGSVLRRLIWYFVNILFFMNPMNPLSGLKVKLLRAFGAKVGQGVRINPSVNIKYPWHLEIGDFSWIGEKVWIDNLTKVTIGANCCLSQGSMLLTGNHNYKKETFDLMIGEITLEDGAWVGAQSVVCPGVTLKSHAILAVGSVATRDLEGFSVFQGNPALFVRQRKF